MGPTAGSTDMTKGMPNTATMRPTGDTATKSSTKMAIKTATSDLVVRRESGDAQNPPTKNDKLMSLPSPALTVKSVRPGTPNFLMKLLQILEDPVSKGLCEWAEDGKSFHVHDPTEFSKKVLPSYFKHTNFLSFVRQLNMYQFNKVIETKSGLDTRADGVRFASTTFIRGRPDLLQAPRPKKKSQPVEQETINQALANINDIRTKQAELERRLGEIKDRTEEVGSAVMAWRQQSQRNQSMIKQIMSFLANIYRPKHNLSTSTANDILALPIVDALPEMLDQSPSSSTVPFVVEEMESGDKPITLKAERVAHPERDFVRPAEESTVDLFEELVGVDTKQRKLGIDGYVTYESPRINPTTDVRETTEAAEVKLPDLRSVLAASSIEPEDPTAAADAALAALPTSSEADAMRNLTRTISLGIEDLQWTLMSADESQSEDLFDAVPSDNGSDSGLLR